MLLTAHVATGALLALAVRNPVLVFPVAVGSHLALDMVPHWAVAQDPRAWLALAALDGLSALCLAAVLCFSTHPTLRLSLCVGVFGASLLDFDKPYRLLTGAQLWPDQVHYVHTAFQHELASLWWVDSLITALAVLCCTILIVRSRSAHEPIGVPIGLASCPQAHAGLARVRLAVTVMGKFPLSRIAGTHSPLRRHSRQRS